jgi:ABC-type uncharacterized transport system substrate-binding protein
MLKIFIVLFALFTALCASDNRKKIFILHSYSQEYGWTKSQHDGFVDFLNQSIASPMEISAEYLDTKRHSFDTSYQHFFSQYLHEKYRNYSPDAIYVTDDNALNFFIAHKENLFPNTPVFFSGVNDLALSRALDPRMYTGVYETKDIVKNIELIRQFSPQTRDIWIIGDGSGTYRSIESDIKAKIGTYTKYRFHFIASPHIDEIRSKLPTAQKSFVILTTIGNLTDKSNRTLTLKESINRLRQHNNLIFCSMEDAYVFGGVIGGYVTSGSNQGMNAARLMTHYLNGKTLLAIPSVNTSPNLYMFDRKALMDARLILSEYIARDAIIFHQDKSFVEKYQAEIVNVMFVFLVIFLIFVLMVFLITVHKNRRLKMLELSLQECNIESEKLKQRLALIEADDE